MAWAWGWRSCGALPRCWASKCAWSARPARARAWICRSRPESPQLGLAVLVIDDEREIRESMAGLLEQLGCSVRCAEGRDEALVEVRGGFTPDVIVADHRLRGHTGQEAIAAVCAIIGARPAVVVTGDTAPQTLQQLLVSGQRVLHKPVDGATLARVLRELSQRPPT